MSDTRHSGQHAGTSPHRLTKAAAAIPRRIAIALLTLVTALTMGLTAARAASSPEFSSAAVTARLITVQNGVPEGSATLSAGLALKLEEGWKTYWRTPGEVGLPPEIDWSGSTNLAAAEFSWPAPQRFSAFGIENFGYHDEIVFPIQIELENPGQDVDLKAQVSLLVCSDVCVPENFELTLALPPGSGIDQQAASAVGRFLDRVPEVSDDAVNQAAEAALTEDRGALTIAIKVDEPLKNPDIFPETPAVAAFGKPDIRLGEDGRLLWATVPLLSDIETELADLAITVTDGPSRAFEVRPQIVADQVPPPFTVTQAGPGLSELAWIALAALLGGLVLNVMPCVLPVLSIKLSSVLRHGDRDRAHLRTGFVAAGFGVLSFMWGLAAIIYLLKLAGATVGWGVQFQSPVFISLMFLIMALFSANLFGAFEISLPAGLQTRLSRAGGKSGYGTDFLTGMLAAVMATPCSAPFLGTAVAFALAGRGVDIFIVFTSMGIGLALPYFLVAAAPRVLAVLPRPGRWMLVLKVIIGILLLGTALWLLWVLVGVAGRITALSVAALVLALIAVVSLPGHMRWPHWTAAALVAVLAVFAVPVLTGSDSRSRVESSKLEWVAFDRPDIAKRVSRGEVVFVDVTADWCLTCKANKALVIERDPVLAALRGPNVTPMQADWTRPDERIARYLESYGRFGIPFNAVFGPSAPQGILLPEILSSDEVLDALKTAAGGSAGLSLLDN